MSDIVDWCREAARYFRKRPTGGEDSAHWANVANAESAERAAAEIERLRDALKGLLEHVHKSTDPIISDCMWRSPATRMREEADRVERMDHAVTRARAALEMARCADGV